MNKCFVTPSPIKCAVLKVDFVNCRVHHPLKTNLKKGDTFFLMNYVCCRGIFLTPDENTCSSVETSCWLNIIVHQEKGVALL
jgi:hypothetical protein